MVEWGCILVARLIGAMEIHYRSAARADLGIATLPFYCSVRKYTWLVACWMIASISIQPLQTILPQPSESA
jgi:hypothetical protein